MRPLAPRSALLALALALAPASALAQGGAPALDEVLPDLPVVEAQLDPVYEQLQAIANPNLSEEQAQRLFDQLVTRGAEALPTLASTFRDVAEASDLEIWISARAMGRIGGPAAMRTLISGLESPRIIVRLGAVSGLALIGDKESAEFLEKALFDRALTVRAYAADALGKIGARRSADALARALNLPANFHRGKSMFVRRHIIDALGAIGSIAGVEVLIETLSDPEPHLALAASGALTQITGVTFRDPGYPLEAAPTTLEIDQWRAWWSVRRVGRAAE